MSALANKMVRSFVTCGFHRNFVQTQRPLVRKMCQYNEESENSGVDLGLLNSAVKVHLRKAKAFADFMEEEQAKFDIAKKHLANMMNLDPDNLTQQEIDDAIAYLLPSGLFSLPSRPMMKPPSEIQPQTSSIKFDMDGRPFTPLFYTASPNTYHLLQKITKIGMDLNKYAQAENREDPTGKYLAMSGTMWCTRQEFQGLFKEYIPQELFDFVISSLERLVQHPYAYKIDNFILKYRKLIVVKKEDKLTELKYDEDGKAYCLASSWRKTATASVKVALGSGKFSINGRNILYFEFEKEREQVMYPLVFTKMLRKVDIECTAEGGGPSGQALAVRLSIAKALTGFLDEDMFIRMRLAGLLSQDVRRHERLKAGQKGARAKRAWRKR